MPNPKTSRQLAETVGSAKLQIMINGMPIEDEAQRDVFAGMDGFRGWSIRGENDLTIRPWLSMVLFWMGAHGRPVRRRDDKLGGSRMSSKNVPLCAVRIGVDDFILPMSDGLKLVAIMGKAVAVNRNYGEGKRWLLTGDTDIQRIELVLVRPSEIGPAPARRMLALPRRTEVSHEQAPHACALGCD